MRRTLVWIALIASASISIAAPASAVPPAERTQFILLSLDTTPSGHRDVEHTDFHRILRHINDDAEHATSSYTVFISTGGLQLDPVTPRPSAEERPFLGVMPRNRPVVRYAEDLSHLQARVRAVQRMHELGIEIGAHGVRHRHGAAFSRDEWRFEMEDHARVLELVGLPAPVGFRAPFMEWNEDLYRVLRTRGFVYDVSQSGIDAWPHRHPGTGLWIFEVPSVTIPGIDTPALLFDLNMETVLAQLAQQRRIPAREREEFMNATFESALDREFRARYEGSRAPLLISGHGGLLTPTLHFMRHACREPQVRCATFSEAVAYVEAHPDLEGAH